MILLKVDGIEGSSTVTGYEKQIQLASFGWGLERPFGSGVAFKPLVVQKHAGISGPALWLANATGKPITSMVLTGLYTGSAKLLPYLVIELYNVHVIAFNETANDDERPTQVVTFDYGKIRTTFSTFDGNGNLLHKYVSGWDLVANKPF